MNPRVRRVRLTREGKPVGELALEVEKRELQTLILDQPGGDFRLEVAEVVMGSRPKWREVCISELEVWGDPGTVAKPGAQRRSPVVRVGTLDLTPTAAVDMEGPLASPCLEEDRANAREKADCARCKPDEEGCCPEGHGNNHCKLKGTGAVGEGPAGTEVDVVLRGTPWVAAHCHLALRTRRGWFQSDLGICEPKTEDEEPQKVADLALQWHATPLGKLLAATFTTGEPPDDGGSAAAARSHWVVLCGIGPSRDPSCTSPIALGPPRRTWKVVGRTLELTGETVSDQPPPAPQRYPLELN